MGWYSFCRKFIHNLIMDQQYHQVQLEAKEWQDWLQENSWIYSVHPDGRPSLLFTDHKLPHQVFCVKVRFLWELRSAECEGSTLLDIQ